MKDRHHRKCILFDWGNTLMRDFKEYSGPMKDWPRVEAVPGALDVLAALNPGWILCLATNADASGEADIRVALRRVDLDRWLEKIYCSRNIGLQKPSLGFFACILSDLGLPPEQVIMVGDNYEVDILSAANCGMHAIWFNELDGENRTGDRIHTIHRLVELPSIVKEWG